MVSFFYEKSTRCCALLRFGSRYPKKAYRYLFGFPPCSEIFVAAWLNAVGLGSADDEHRARIKQIIIGLGVLFQMYGHRILVSGVWQKMVCAWILKKIRLWSVLVSACQLIERPRALPWPQKMSRSHCLQSMQKTIHNHNNCFKNKRNLALCCAPKKQHRKAWASPFCKISWWYQPYNGTKTEISSALCSRHSWSKALVKATGVFVFFISLP